MNQRDILLNLVNNQEEWDYVPAGFFMHFDPAFHQGQAAIDKHLEFFRATGMDFVKIQYEGGFPPAVRIRKADDWMNVPFVGEEFFQEQINVAEGLVKAVGDEALVIMTVYSPFMWATHLDRDADIMADMKENPEAVRQGLEIMTENVRRFVRGCMRVGVDGFYTSTQGGEAFRLGNSELFTKYVKPSDLAIWEEIKGCAFNILHVCDYEGEYTDLSPFLDYPGQIVNSSLALVNGSLSAQEVSEMFGRPFMGGLDRKGLIATGSKETIRLHVEQVLKNAPERFILAADCTVPGETPWENLKTAIDTAHIYR